MKSFKDFMKTSLPGTTVKAFTFSDFMKAMDSIESGEKKVNQLQTELNNGKNHSYDELEKYYETMSGVVSSYDTLKKIYEQRGSTFDDGGAINYYSSIRDNINQQLQQRKSRFSEIVNTTAKGIMEGDRDFIKSFAQSANKKFAVDTINKAANGEYVSPEDIDHITQFGKSLQGSAALNDGGASMQLANAIEKLGETKDYYSLFRDEGDYIRRGKYAGKTYNELNAYLKELKADKSKNKAEIAFLEAYITEKKKTKHIDDAKISMYRDPDFQQKVIEAVSSGLSRVFQRQLFDENGYIKPLEFEYVPFDKSIFNMTYEQAIKKIEENPQVAIKILNDAGVFGKLLGTSNGSALIKTSPYGVQVEGGLNLKYLTAEEVALIAYTSKTKGSKEANLLMDELERTLGQRYAESEMLKMKEKYDNTDFWGAAGLNATTVLASPFTALDALVDDVGDLITKGAIDPYNSASNIIQMQGEHIRTLTAEDIEKSTGSEALRMLYNGAMSAADMLVWSPLLGPAAYSLTMGAKSFVSEARQLYNEGAEDWQVATVATIKASLEIATEKMGADRFLDTLMNSGESAGKKLISNILSEIAEEEASLLAGDAFDRVIRGEYSTYETKVRGYILDGMTEQQAREKASKDFLNEAAETAITTFFSVLISSGPVTAVKGTGNLLDKRANTKAIALQGYNILNNENVDELIEIGLSFGENTRAYKLAQKFNSDTSLKNNGKRVGYLYDAVIKQIEGQITQKAYTATQKRLESLGVDLQTAHNASRTIVDMAKFKNVDAKAKQAVLSNTAQKQVYFELTDALNGDQTADWVNAYYESIQDLKVQRNLTAATAQFTNEQYSQAKQQLNGENNGGIIDSTQNTGVENDVETYAQEWGHSGNSQGGVRPLQENLGGNNDQSGTTGIEQRESQSLRNSENRGSVTLTDNQSAELRGTAIKNEDGSPKVVCHFTENMDFEVFGKGDIGFHFGDEAQANSRGNILNKTGRIIKAYLNIKNPLNISTDIMSWRPKSLALKLFADNIITVEQYEIILEMDIGNADYNSPAAALLRRILAEKGYDGIVYQNMFEGDGESYIAFYPEQVIIIDDGKGGNNTDLQSSANEDVEADNVQNDKKEYISLNDFANREAKIWRNVDYTDEDTKSAIMQETHRRMVDEGAVVKISDEIKEKVNQSFPNLHAMKKKERTPILKEAMRKLKYDMRQFLNGFKNQGFEFEVNGKVLEATLYNTGIDEVLEKITQEKASMLYSTEEIFKNSRYLYSTTDYDSDPNVRRWNYFYTPVQIGEETVGVRIAVRDIATPAESQIYNWGIKKDTSLDGVGRGNNRISYDVSSDVSNNRLSQENSIVKNNSMQQSAENSSSDKKHTENDVSEDKADSAEKDQYAKDESFWKAENENDKTVSKGLRAKLEALFGQNKQQKVVSLDEIITLIEKEFGVPVSTGRFKQKAYGIYKNKPKAIRTKVSNALPTIAHELGHHLDNRYGLRNFDSIDEAIQVLKEQRPDFAAAYEKSKLPGEAIAEFIRIYLADRNLAKSMFPTFYNEFVSKLPKMTAKVRGEIVKGSDDMQSLNAIGDKINKYYTAEKADAARATVVTRAEAKRIERMGVRLSDILERAVTKWVDKARPIKKVSQRAYELFTYSLKSTVRAKNSISGYYLAGLDGKPLNLKGAEYKSITDEDGNVLAFKYLLNELQSDEQINDFRMYLIYKHGIEWLKDGKRIFADDGINNEQFMTTQINELEQQNPVFKETAERVYLWQKAFMQEYAVKSGLVTEEAMERLNQKYPCYIPFFRHANVKGWGVKSSIADQKSLIKRAKGSGLSLYDPFENIIVSVDRWMKAADRNRVMQEIANTADTEEGLGYLLEKVDLKKVPNTVYTDLSRSNFEQALKELYSAKKTESLLEIFDETVGESITNFKVAQFQGASYATVMKNGKMSVYQIHDENLLTAVMGMNEADIKGILKMLGTMTRIMKALTTGVNAVWALTSNSIRDIQSAFMYSSQNNPASFTVDYIKAVGMVLKENFGNKSTETMKLYKTAGGGFNNSLSSNLKTIRATVNDITGKPDFKERLKKLLNILNHIEALSDAIETAPRIAEFKRVYEKTKDYKKALVAAEEITVNFNRSGTSGKTADQIIPYFNASVQGLYKLTTTVKNENGNRNAFAAKVISCAVLTTLLQVAFMYVSGEDGEEEYEKLSSYKKNNFYNFYIGDGKFITIPKPKELGLMASFLERTVETATKDDPDLMSEIKEYSSYAFDMLIPPLLDEAIVFGTIADIRANEDYKGSPIVSSYYETLLPEDQYNEKTSYIARFLGNWFGYSPMKIDYIINSNLGVLGTLNQSFLSPEGDFVGGIKNKFYTDSAYSTDVFNRFYENADYIAKNAKSNPDDAEAVYKNKQYTAVKSIVSALNQYGKDLDLEREYKIYARDYVDDFEKNSEVDKRIVELLERTGDNDILYDKTFSATYSIDGKKYTVPAEKYLEYIEEYYSLIQEAYDKILNRSYSDERTVALLKEEKNEIEKKLKRKYKTGKE